MVDTLGDGDQVATLRFTLSVVFDIGTVVAGITAGLLVAIDAGRCDVTASLNFQGTDVLTTRTHRELPGLIKLGPGIRLLHDDDCPASGQASKPAA
jgi:hypothetical protein